MIINYISKSAEECKKLEDAMDVFQQNYRLVPSSLRIGVSLESMVNYVTALPTWVSHINIFPLENNDKIIKINSMNPSGKFLGCNADNLGIQIGERCYIIHYKNPNNNATEEKQDE